MTRLNIAALVICAIFVGAVFAPWVTIGGLFSASLTQGEDAPFLIGFAVVTALCFWRWPLKLVTPIIGIMAALFMAAEVGVVIGRLSEKSDTGNEIADAIVGATAPAWGMYLGAIVAVALFVVSIMTIVQRRAIRHAMRFEQEPPIEVIEYEHDEVSEGQRERREFYSHRDY